MDKFSLTLHTIHMPYAVIPQFLCDRIVLLIDHFRLCERITLLDEILDLLLTILLGYVE